MYLHLAMIDATALSSTAFMDYKPLPLKFAVHELLSEPGATLTFPVYYA